MGVVHLWVALYQLLVSRAASHRRLSFFRVQTICSTQPLIGAWMSCSNLAYLNGDNRHWAFLLQAQPLQILTPRRPTPNSTDQVTQSWHNWLMGSTATWQWNIDDSLVKSIIRDNDHGKLWQGTRNVRPAFRQSHRKNPSSAGNQNFKSPVPGFHPWKGVFIQSINIWWENENWNLLLLGDATQRPAFAPYRSQERPSWIGAVVGSWSGSH